MREFVRTNIKLDYDSYPCWKLEKPAERYFNPCFAVQVCGENSLFILACGLLALLVRGINK